MKRNCIENCINKTAAQTKKIDCAKCEVEKK